MNLDMKARYDCMLTFPEECCFVGILLTAVALVMSNVNTTDLHMTESL